MIMYLGSASNWCHSCHKPKVECGGCKKFFDEIISMEPALKWFEDRRKSDLKDVTKDKPRYKWSWKNNRAERVL
jgi:hypothetical protein